MLQTRRNANSSDGTPAAASTPQLRVLAALCVYTVLTSEGFCGYRI
jgi:hypothetical protein